MSNSSRYIGVTGNVFGGTAKGVTAGGTANNSIGGTVFRPAGQSSHQFPVSAANTINTGSGGSAPATQISSNNPLIPQAEVLKDSSSQEQRNAVAQTTSSNISSPANGEQINFPTTTKTISYSKVNGYSTVANQSTDSAYVGITNNKTFVVDELTRISEMERVADNNTNKKVDGAAQGANHKDKFSALGDNVQTKSMNTLPNGVDQSQKIG